MIKHLILLKIGNMDISMIKNGAVKNEIISNKKLAQGLPKPIIRTFKKRKMHSLL